MADHAAAGVFEDFDERDAVRVDAVAVGEPHDDVVQAVVHDQVCPHFLAHQLRAGRPQDFLAATLEGLDLPGGRFRFPALVIQGRQLLCMVGVLVDKVSQQSDRLAAVDAVLDHADQHTAGIGALLACEVHPSRVGAVGQVPHRTAGDT
ncbi:hypothetical protein [Streptomyces shenzhenensis]|uniref:hypothetical protein n=1 Tax=Streptomyces shenzhenensis TaxID=943815 RepID=UPI001F1F1CE7|nr:hypothetical protein [Streptomyces shenzhenensis]